MEYFLILLSEVYKIIFFLIPVLTAVALIVWLDRRIWALFKKEEVQMLLVHLVYFNH